MKVGFIFECGPNGADKQVCEHLARLLVPTIEIRSITLENKPNLLAGCGQFAAGLLSDDGCDRVLVVWDLFPAWRLKGAKPCRREDREAIFQSLQQARVPPERVQLICIQEELEAWLIADGRGLTQVLSKPPHPFKIAECKYPERQKNPKKLPTQIFQSRGGRYVDYVDAVRIIKGFPDLNRLRRRCSTFARFEAKLLSE